MTKDKLKSEIQEDRKAFESALSDKQNNHADEREAQQLQQQLQSPVDEKYANLQPIKLRINNVRVGNLTAATVYYGKSPTEKRELPDSIRQQPDKILDLIPIETPDPNDDDPVLGYANGKKVVVSKYNLSDEKISQLDQDIQIKAQQGEPVITDAPPAWNKFYKGNSISIKAITNHEINHQAQDIKGGLRDSSDSPTTTARKNRLTETTSCAVEYLTVANIYSKLKQEGKTTFTYEEHRKTQTAPLDEMLDYYPGLKDCILKNGFSIDEPETIGNVVKLASSNWHKTHIVSYNEQAKTNSVPTEMSFSAILRNITNGDEEKTYQTDVKNMLKDVYIGENTAVDLSPFNQYLDTMSKTDAEHLLTNTAVSPPKRIPEETALAINEYLEKQGLTTNQEKDDYIKSAFTKIINRSPEADMALKNIIMQNGGEIKYADGIIETYHKDTHIRTVQNGENGKKHIVNNFDTHSPANSNKETENITTTLLLEQAQSTENTATKGKENSLVQNNAEKFPVKTQINPLLLKQMQNSKG